LGVGGAILKVKPTTKTKTPIVLYRCEQCDSLHRWEFAGDCRDNAERFSDEDDFVRRRVLAADITRPIEIRSWENRWKADLPKPEPTGKTKKDLTRVILAIQETLWPGGDSEAEWSSDELEQIADIMDRNGFGPKEVDEC
jgi:hypothetical protein